MKHFEDRKKFGTKRSFGGSHGGDRPMYPAVCAKCGQDCQVPFRPSGNKEVLCSNCYEKDGGRPSGPRSFGGRDSRDGGSSSRSNPQLEIISAKLDKIIELLSSQQ